MRKISKIKFSKTEKDQQFGSGNAETNVIILWSYYKMQLKSSLWLNDRQPVKVLKSLKSGSPIFRSNLRNGRNPSNSKYHMAINNCQAIHKSCIDRNSNAWLTLGSKPYASPFTGNTDTRLGCDDLVILNILILSVGSLETSQLTYCKIAYTWSARSIPLTRTAGHLVIWKSWPP